MLLEILAPRERSGALEHELDPKILPRQLRRVTDAQDLQLATGDNQAASIDEDGLRVAPVHRVETKQVGEIFDVGQVVDGGQLEAGSSITSFRIARPIRPKPLMATLMLIWSFRLRVVVPELPLGVLRSVRCE